VIGAAGHLEQAQEAVEVDRVRVCGADVHDAGQAPQGLAHALTIRAGRRRKAEPPPDEGIAAVALEEQLRN